MFSTSLTRVTEYFKNEDILEALDRIAREVHDWSGGTRIGQSLTTFNERWARKLVNRHTIVLILSDGLDTGDAEVLREAMEDLQEHAVQGDLAQPAAREQGLPSAGARHEHGPASTWTSSRRPTTWRASRT